jgi:hypothetical protein
LRLGERPSHYPLAQLKVGRNNIAPQGLAQLLALLRAQNHIWDETFTHFEETSILRK